MAGWQLTLGLQNLRTQVNDAFPDRDKTSDGTIGDAAHMAEMSGHNPDDTAGSKAAYNDHDGIAEVRAWDMDSDLSMYGVDAQDVVDHVRHLPGVSAVIRYIIYNRRMYHERDGFAPTLYTGPSAHTEHVHFEGAWIAAADNDTTFDYRLEDIPVALTAADKAWIQGQIAAVPANTWNYPLEDPLSTTTPKGKKTAGTYQRYTDAVTNAAAARIAAAVGQDDVDEGAIVTGVLAGLTPEKIAAAIPAELAQQVADELGARINRPAS